MKRDIMRTLAERFLPLVPSLPHPKYCVMPLWACAKTQYGWAGDGEGGGEVPLAEALLRRLGQDGCALLQQANAQDNANLWWALSEAPNPELVAAQGQLLAASAECLVGMRGKGMVPQVCSNVLLACARLQYSDARLVHHMTRCLVEFSDLDAQQLSNALYALGELREDCGHMPHQEDLDQLMSAIAQRLRGGRTGEEVAAVLKPQQVSNILLGCAKLKVEGGEAVQLLAAAAGAVAGRMTGQGLANSVWALGKLLGAGQGGGSGIPTSSAPGRLSASGGGCATTANAVVQLLQEVPRRLRRNGAAAPVFTCQALSNTLYGMALLQSYILKAAGTAMEGSIRTAWSAALTAATEALAGECEGRSFEGFKPQEVANATWALAQLGHSDQGWFTAAVAAAQRPAFASAAVPMAWAQLWSALALVRHRPPPELVECTARAVVRHARRLASQDCSVLLWSFAVLGVWEERLAGVLLGRLAELVVRGQGQEVGARGGGGPEAESSAFLLVEQNLANALWAVAVAGPGALVAHSREVGMLLREAVRRWEKGASFVNEQLQQLWQVQLELQAVEGGEGGGPAALSPILPGACRGNGEGRSDEAAGNGTLLAAMERAADEERQGGGTTVSSMQREVAAALRRLQLLQQRQQQQQQQQQHGPPRAQLLEPQGSEQEGQAEGGAAASDSPDGYRSFEPVLAVRKIQLEALVPALRSQVDVLVEWSDGRVVAVEVDGPTHYMRNSPYKRTKDGPTMLRDRQLARVFGQGNVVCVPHWEWEAVKRDSEAAEAYLWGLLVAGEGAAEAVLRAAVAGVGKKGPRRVQQQEQQQQRQQQQQQMQPPSTASSAPGSHSAGRVTAEGGVNLAGVGARGRRPRAGPQGAALTGEAGHGCAAPGMEAARPEAPGPQRGAGATRRGQPLGEATAGVGREGQASPGVGTRVLVPRQRRRKKDV